MGRRAPGEQRGVDGKAGVKAHSGLRNWHRVSAAEIVRKGVTAKNKAAGVCSYLMCSDSHDPPNPMSFSKGQKKKRT